MTAWAGWSRRRASGKPTNPARIGRNCRNRRHPPWRVYFADENNGWAACNKKTVLVTHDGGHKWEADPGGIRSARRAGALGLLVDQLRQPELRHRSSDSISRPCAGASRFPAWMDPEDAVEPPRDAPPLLQHGDARRRQDLAGWVDLAASDRSTRARFSANGPGLGLIEYGDSGRLPERGLQARLDHRQEPNHLSR